MQWQHPKNECSNVEVPETKKLKLETNVHKEPNSVQQPVVNNRVVLK